MWTRRHRFLGLLLLLVLVTAAVGCEMATHERSTIAPVSDFGAALLKVYRQVFWWTVGIFIFVEGLLLTAIFKFRAREDSHEMPEQVYGHTRLELAWTIVPAVILVFIAVPTVRTIFAVAAPVPPDAIRIKVTGQQWFWHFDYPDLGVRTANEMHIPVGKPVSVELSSADIIHSFWVPRIGGKRDIIPNHNNRQFFTVDRAGDYRGQCAEFCGASHALMRFDVIAEDEASFERWVEHQKQPASPSLEPKAQKGATTFLTAGCIACHRIQGTPAQAMIGPDLTHVGSRNRIVSGLFDNTPDNMAHWIRNPQAVKPLARMPNLKLKDDQIEVLVAYLQSLK
ncbi:MAG: cytochrome c oxidase subunit II [Deltaproteobacteria bacterium RBG_13_65_10]|nr:MAG: cytochrome c oxidase subunit II [Deltaproteobacteria bacterium RBG_13_65_10]